MRDEISKTSNSRPDPIGAADRQGAVAGWQGLVDAVFGRDQVATRLGCKEQLFD